MPLEFSPHGQASSLRTQEEAFLLQPALDGRLGDTEGLSRVGAHALDDGEARGWLQVQCAIIVKPASTISARFPLGTTEGTLQYLFPSPGVRFSWLGAVWRRNMCAPFRDRRGE